MSCFIGFGSLVNTDTHVYSTVAPVRIDGWSRVWINNDTYEHAFLSVIPEQQTSVLGLLASVPHGDWNELDIRESGYHRRALARSEWSIETGGGADTSAAESSIHDVQMYVHSSGNFATPAKPILRSYLETVLSGFYTVFGERGLRNFIDTTAAWTVIKDDRGQPLYPRYISAQGEAVGVVEDALAELQKYGV